MGVNALSQSDCGVRDGCEPAGQQRKNSARVASLTFVLVLVASVCAARVPGAGAGGGGPAHTCLSCHQDDAAAHIRELAQSIHARFGIGCTSCHSLQDAAPPLLAEPRGDLVCMRKQQTVMEICQRCHADVAQAFRESLHYRRAGEESPSPTCVTCHSSAGGHVIADESLSPRCAACHRKGGTVGEPWVSAKAPTLLNLLRQVTLARTLVAERFRVAEDLGRDVAHLRAAMHQVEASFRDLPFEWHRFNFRELEAHSTHAMEALELLNAQLAGIVPEGRQAAPGAPRGRQAEETAALLPASGPPLRFAVSTMLGPVETYDSYVGLFNDLARSLGRPYQFVQRRTYQEINELLLRGELDLAFICSGAFVALPPGAPIEILALPVVNGESVYHSLIIVHADSSVRRFEDLKGARFAFTDPLSNTGYVYPVFRLAEFGTDPTRFFASTMFSGSHDRSILAVYRKLVDAAAVDDLVYKKLVIPQSPYWQRLRVVESSPDFAVPPVVASTALPAEVRAQMRNFLLGLANSEAGRQRLRVLGFDGFTTAGEENYAPIRRMLEVSAEQSKQSAR